MNESESGKDRIRSIERQRVRGRERGGANEEKKKKCSKRRDIESKQRFLFCSFVCVAQKRTMIGQQHKSMKLE